jgi:hypothetical protein
LTLLAGPPWLTSHFSGLKTRNHPPQHLQIAFSPFLTAMRELTLLILSSSILLSTSCISRLIALLSRSLFRVLDKRIYHLSAYEYMEANKEFPPLLGPNQKLVEGGKG